MYHFVFKSYQWCPPSIILQVGVSPLVQQFLDSLYISLQDPEKTTNL